MTLAMIKIGLTQRVEDVAGRQERRDGLDQAWTRLLTPLGFWPVPLPNRIAGASDAAALVAGLGLQGMILTGGNDLSHLPQAVDPAPERDRFESHLLELCAARRLPLLGVCRGLQKLVCDAGGELVESPGHRGTEHAIRAEPRRGIPLTDRDQVNSFHAYGLSTAHLGRHLEAVAFTDDGFVEAVVHTRLPMWGVMWHPERGDRHEGDVAILRALFDGAGS